MRSVFFRLPVARVAGGILLGAVCPRGQAQPEPPATAYTLTVSQLVRLVLERNASVQEKMLDYAVDQRKAQAERGVFEPEAFGSGSHEFNRRQNSTEQAAQANGVSILEEVNNLFEGGIEAVIPTGALRRPAKPDRPAPVQSPQPV